uniref:GIY-YIG endonuclease n=1 Tax=Metarhizium album TaxID=92629 RepID=A0A891GZB3_9HYPO|nr:GIY-YIG endonuclease [Metarhizium album]QRK27486.1 GIY-YIG endonuclease [Metarhizium album]
MNHLALPLKTTICWELLTIIELGLDLNSVILYNFEQSAGNQQVLNISVGSSETIRGPRNMFTRRYSPWNKNLFLSFHKPLIRKYSSINQEDNLKELKPIVRYDNFKEDRARILKEQKDRSGVYCLINNSNGYCYIGSSVHLSARMKNYLNTAFLKGRQNINMPIVKALLKYGQSNFSLLILEYVDLDMLTVIETYYITSVVPYYNVLKQGYSSLGYKHTEETKELLAQLAKNKTHSDKTKGLIARALIGENNPFYNKSHSIESKRRIIETKSAYSVYIYNSFKELLIIFPSVSTLAKKINSNHSSIVNIIKEQSIFRGEWYFSNIPFNIEDKPKITNWDSLESEKIVKSINNNSHIRRAVFVYDINKNFICKYSGVMETQKALNINHSTIKKYAKIEGTYNGYIFSYERLNNK